MASKTSIISPRVASDILEHAQRLQQRGLSHKLSQQFIN